jgi:uncharacterized protein
MMAVPITALYAALQALLNLGLALHVSWVRQRDRVFLGDPPTPSVTLASRVHGNHAEYVALALVLQWLAEVSGAPAAAVHGLGIALLAGRLAHAGGAFARLRWLRVLGVTVTYLYLGAVPLYLLYAYFSAR